MAEMCEDTCGPRHVCCLPLGHAEYHRDKGGTTWGAVTEERQSLAKDAEIAKLRAENEQLRHANESLNMQLENRIKLEHTEADYISAVKERSVWVQKCASLARDLASAQKQAEEHKAEADRLRGAFEKEAASIAVEWGLSGEIVLQGIKFLIRRDEETSETTAEALP
jgi:hypothetical protein